MIITIVIDTFNMNNNGTTISAMRFAEVLLQRGHRIRIVACGDPTASGIDLNTGFEMFYVPERIIPVATRFAHRQSTLFAQPVRPTLIEAIAGADAVHIYQPFRLGRDAQKIAKQLGVPAMAAFHIQPENITYNIGLGWFRPAAHFLYFLLKIVFYRKFAHIHCPSQFIANQLRSHRYKAQLHVISNGVHPAFCPAVHPEVHAAANSGEAAGETGGLTPAATPGPALQGPGVEPRPVSGIDPVRILMVGRLSPEKRQDVLIRAVRLSKYRDRIQLYFAGKGPWDKKLLQMGKSLPRPPVFGYYDRQGLIELMRSCDLYVHASDIEIEGISCIEAFSCGLVPVISDSSRSAAAQFALCVNNLFEAGNPASLAGKMDYWLDNEDELEDFRKQYAKYGKEYELNSSVRQMELVYELLPVKKNHVSHPKRVFKIISYLFYRLIAIPLLFIWVRIIMGVRIKGERNLRRVKGGAVTLCNHVHTLDSAVVGLSISTRKLVFPTLPENLNSFWPGKLITLLGGVAIPRETGDLRDFLDRMEDLLQKGRLVHFFPEGELKPYDTDLREFKKGAFYLASRACVPVVPMAISFKKPMGLRRLIQKEPVMVLRVGKPIYPLALDHRKDSKVRMDMGRIQMERMLYEKEAKLIQLDFMKRFRFIQNSKDKIA